MSITFSITPKDGSTITYAGIDHAAGRYALAVSPASRDYEIKRRHVMGVDGNYVVRGGATGGLIVCRVRYVGLLATAIGYYNADLAAMANKACTVVDDGGASYTRCELITNGAIRTSDPVATGRSNLVYFDAQFSFMRDD